MGPHWQIKLAAIPNSSAFEQTGAGSETGRKDVAMEISQLKTHRRI